MSKGVTTNAAISERFFVKIMLLLAALTPLVYHAGLFDFTLVPKRFIVQLGVFFIAILWALDISQNRIKFQSSPIYIPLFAYLICAMLSAVQATNPIASLISLSHLITFATVSVLAIHLFPIAQLPNLTRVLAYVGIGVSFLGILEGLGTNFSWFPPSNGRPSATFGYRNFAAAYLIMTLPLTLCHILCSKNKQDFFLSTIATGMMFTFLLYTRTRGAWLGLFVATLIVSIIFLITKKHTLSALSLSPLLLSRKHQLFGLLILLFFVGLAFVSPKPTASQARSIDEKKVALSDALTLTSNPQSIQVRLALWGHTLNMIQDHPIFGVGPGNWPYAYAQYDQGDLLRADQEPLRPHNDLLWIAAEMGILGLLAFLSLICVAAHLFWQALKNAQDTNQTYYTLAIAISLLATLGHGIVSFPRELAETSYLFWLGIALLTLLAKQNQPSQKSAPLISYLLPCIMLLVVIFTYRQVQFEKYYFEARQYHLGQDFQTTLQKATTARQWGAFDHQIFLLLGDSYQAANMMPQAAKTYQEGLRYHPNAIQLLGALGTTAARQNQLDTAEKYYHKVLQIYPDYYQMNNNLGGIYQKRGQIDQAILEYQKALERDPYYTDAYLNLGLAYLEKNEPAKAIQTYKRAVDHKINEPILFHDLGDAYYQLKPQTPQTLTMAYQAYTHFFKIWHGSKDQVARATQRHSEIQQRLSKATP